MKKFKLKRKILRFIASFTVFFRMNIIRDARVSLIQYKYQKLENPFELADDKKKHK
jgi:exosortase/archaeosortase